MSEAKFIFQGGGDAIIVYDVWAFNTKTKRNEVVSFERKDYRQIEENMKLVPHDYIHFHSRPRVKNNEILDYESILNPQSER